MIRAQNGTAALAIPPLYDQESFARRALERPPYPPSDKSPVTPTENAGAMKSLSRLFEANRAWAAATAAADPSFFRTLEKQQVPQFLWIGCSDSRVPATQITGLMPGEVFVHRNVANQVLHSDLNVLSVLQFAVEHLKVEHIIVCGHLGCGGVQAALEDASHGLVDHWIRPIRELALRQSAALKALPNAKARLAHLCDLNVRQQVAHVASTTIVQDAWRRGQSLAIHGWLYALSDGLLRDTGMYVQSLDDAQKMWNEGLPWECDHGIQPESRHRAAQGRP